MVYCFLFIIMAVFLFIFFKLETTRKDFYSKYEEKFRNKNQDSDSTSEKETIDINENEQTEEKIVSLSGCLKAKKPVKPIEESKIKVPDSIIENTELTEDYIIKRVGDRSFVQMIFILEDKVEMITTAVADINNRLDNIDDNLEQINKVIEKDNIQILKDDCDKLKEEVTEIGYNVVRLESTIKKFIS